MKCPHCQSHFHDNPNHFDIKNDSDGYYNVFQHLCPNPACGKMTMLLQRYRANGYSMGGRSYAKDGDPVMLYPKHGAISKAHPDVPLEYAIDYEEAQLVLNLSPKASAALSRRCLQNILHNKLQIKEANLYLEISKLLATPGLPTHITSAVDAVRHFGNFGAHPLPDVNTGTIVEVEDHEAEWSVTLIETLFDFVFVQPAETQRKVDALNTKLAQAGKQKMKT